MMLVWILLSVTLVSLVSLIGVITFSIKAKALDDMLILLVGFSAGALIGGAFLHLLPEAVESYGGELVFFYAIVGFTIFFLMERYVYWRHCHSDVCDIHAFTYLNLIGDGVHNFTDGLLIAVSFLANIKLGVVTTLAVLLHEIPQEMGDFGILVYGGFSRTKALFFNFLCALTAIIGALVGYFMVNIVDTLSGFLIAFTGGGFIYIAASDLIPELHKQKENRRSNLALLTFIFGILFMVLIKFF